MNSQSPCPNTKFDKVMNSEQFTEVVVAIHEGKYSWACVLILRFAGYNPLHYIPYRTYNRLMKGNCQVNTLPKHRMQALNANHQYSESNNTSSQKCLSKITDLAVVEEVVDNQHLLKNGGHLEHWLSSKTKEHDLFNSEFQQYPTQKLSIYNR